MENRIEKLFKAKKEKIVSVFFTAGYPKLNDTLSIIKALDEAEVDMIEIGIPFSDPLADGKTIQESSSLAIKNGMTLAGLFEQLVSLRSITDKPVLLMGYLNSVLQFGVNRFYEQCKKCGIDGVILPDLPIEEYEVEHKALAESNHMIHVFLATPGTSAKRIEKIKKVARGFVYMVSSNSTTGNEFNDAHVLKKIIPDFNFEIPVLIGFGIKSKKSFDSVCEIANGAIIGSEYLRRISSCHNINKTTREFINEIKYSHDYTVK